MLREDIQREVLAKFLFDYGIVEKTKDEEFKINQDLYDLYIKPIENMTVLNRFFDDVKSFDEIIQDKELLNKTYEKIQDGTLLQGPVARQIYQNEHMEKEKLTVIKLFEFEFINDEYNPKFHDPSLPDRRKIHSILIRKKFHLVLIFPKYYQIPILGYVPDMVYRHFKKISQLKQNIRELFEL